MKAFLLFVLASLVLAADDAAIVLSILCDDIDYEMSMMEDGFLPMDAERYAVLSADYDVCVAMQGTDDGQ